MLEDHFELVEGEEATGDDEPNEPKMYAAKDEFRHRLQGWPRDQG